MSGPTIAIIGAGMAGLSCATELARHGIAATLFDKGRGPGGRMATRRAQHNGETLHFDHGAQYFTARDAAFADCVGKWLVRSVVAPWPAAGDHAFVGTPGMNAPLKYMARDLDVRWGIRVERICWTGEDWQVESEQGKERFASVICAIPAEQAATLLEPSAPEFAAEARGSHSAPCWAVMVRFAAPMPLPDIIRSREGAISWAARNSAKPGRTGEECWVLHGSPEYSQELVDHPAPEAGAAILARFFEQAGIDPVTPGFVTAHRWLYAMAQPRDGAPMLWDDALRLGVCGDWLVEPRVEGAWRSGRAMAEAVIAAFNAGTRPI